jgi:hypothetical protein
MAGMVITVPNGIAAMSKLMVSVLPCGERAYGARSALLVPGSVPYAGGRPRRRADMVTAAKAVGAPIV